MTPVAVDVHGFGGGFTLGAAQAGWDLAAKFSREVGFGVLNALANHDMLGANWDAISTHPVHWEPIKADLVFGNPPCAAFSSFNTAKGGSRGMDSSINDYMWELIRYAGRVAPPMAIFESVQNTFNQGLPLMRKLRDELEEISGQEYQLLHVLHNNASVGGVSIRKRYFWVATRVPFGVESGVVNRDGSGWSSLQAVPTFGDMLRDLEPLGLTLNRQMYKGVQCVCTLTRAHGPERTPALCRCSEVGLVQVVNSSDWCRREVHDGTGWVDGHDIEHRPHTGRVRALLLADDNPAGVEWRQGAELAEVMRDYLAKNGELPKEWQYMSWIPVRNEDGTNRYWWDGDGKRHTERVAIRKDERLIKSEFAMGPHQPHRWHADRLARVITGGGTNAVYHPTQPRTLTQREVARIQGFPDDWQIWPVRNAPDLGAAWGKGVPVQAARWITYWAKQSLEGNPGGLTGAPLSGKHRAGKSHGVAERELVIDVTRDYKPFARAIGDPG